MPKGSSELNRATESRAFQPVMAKKRMPNKDWRPSSPISSRPSKGIALDGAIRGDRKERFARTIGEGLAGLVGPVCWLAIGWIGRSPRWACWIWGYRSSNPCWACAS